MSDGKIVNSDIYWDGRFSSDWEAFEGPQQSRFFATLAMENLPSWLMAQVRRQSLTLADWGCAQGDGTDVWASYVDPQQLVGVDFSEVAIRKAESRYPAIRFVTDNWLDEKSRAIESFDIVFSSNTLEHFYRPWDVLEALSARANKAVVLALPYRELNRIEEHFYSFLPENIPLELSNGFYLLWSKVIDCRLIENTLWNGDQVFLVYAEKSWVKSLDLTLSDCSIEKESMVSRADVLIHEASVRDGQIPGLSLEAATRDAQVACLSQEVAARDEQIARLSQEVAERDEQIGRLSQEVAARDGQLINLNQEVALRGQKINDFMKSTSWRITKPLRGAKTLFQALTNESDRYRVLKAIYWKLPKSLRVRLNEQRYKYVARHFQASVENSSGGAGAELTPSQDWVIAANAVQKIAIIPCGFEFDELVNQRPINAAKYFSRQGYLVLFIPWQWSRGDVMQKGVGQVWPGIYQVPLFDLIDFERELSVKQMDALYLLTMPARILVDLVPNFRSRGYSIVYDVMDEWEEFHKSGQAPWFERDVELNLVLQSDVVCAVAPALISKFSEIRDDIQLIGNGYHQDVLGAEFRGIAGKHDEAVLTVGYFGHLTDAWFDWPAVFELAEAQPKLQFDVIGYGEPEWVRERVAQMKNIRLLGKVHPNDLHTHVRRWSFGIIPFVEGDLARAVDPIKIYEYLYFGLPTFVTGIEHLQSYPNVVFAKRSAALSVFSEFIERPLAEGPVLDEFLENTTWDARFSQLQSCISKKMIIGDMYAL